MTNKIGMLQTCVCDACGLEQKVDRREIESGDIVRCENQMCDGVILNLTEVPHPWSKRGQKNAKN